MITLRKIAADLGLDRGTVSHILSKDDSRYNSATRKRVRDYAAKIGYRPNAVARAMRTKRTGIIGFLFRQEPGHSLINEHYYARVIEGVESELLDAGYKILLSSVSNAEIASCQLPSIVADGFIEGLIVLGTSDQHWLKQVLRACKKTIIVDESPEGFPAVLSANFDGGRLAAQYLWERGHRSFALITGHRPNLNFETRLHGFQSWIAEKLNTSVQLPIYVGDAWSNGGAVAAGQILAKGERPTSVFCVNDHLAIDAMAEFQNAGYRVPEDISIVGFDDLSISAYTSPPLTTVAVDKRQMGREAAKIIVDCLRKSVPVPVARKELSLSMVERASVSFQSVSR
jgi:LacI family transcriptional regulator